MNLIKAFLRDSIGIFFNIPPSPCACIGDLNTAHIHQAIRGSRDIHEPCGFPERHGIPMRGRGLPQVQRSFFTPAGSGPPLASGKPCNLDGKQTFPADIRDRVDKSTHAFGVERCIKETQKKNKKTERQPPNP